MTKKTVVITGAAGFIGRYVAREFAKKDWRVIGLGRGNWIDWRDYGLDAWYSVDIKLDSLLEHAGQPDAIVHCAGGASVGFSIDCPAMDFDMTVHTTSIVLDFIRIHSPASKFVYLSSAAVYGQVQVLPVTEDSPLNPVSPYGLHKQMSEALCQLYAIQYGVSVIIVRLFSIYGPGLRKQLLWDACKKIQKGNCVFFGTGGEVRDWLHVEDAANLLFIATQKASSICPVVNVGSGLGVSVKDILLCLSNQFFTDNPPIFTSETKVGDPDKYVADITKAQLWNWEPKIKWRDGLSEYVEWYKQCQ